MGSKTSIGDSSIKQSNIMSKNKEALIYNQQ
jgi:hypothetical protein